MDRSKLFATCNTPSSLSHSSQDRFSVSFTSWSSLLWTHSSTFFKWGAQSWAHWFCLIVIKNGLKCHSLVSGTHLVNNFWWQESQLVNPHVAGSCPIFPSLVLPDQASHSLWGLWKMEPLQVFAVLLYWGELLYPSLIVFAIRVFYPSVLPCQFIFSTTDPARGGQQGPWPWGSVVGCSFGIPSSELFYRPQTLCS